MENTPLLIILLLVLFLNSSSAVELRCGKTPVPYPLSTGPNCGDKAYKIKCNPSTSTLFFDSKMGVAYPIESINARAQRMVIRPPSVTPGTCLSEDFKVEGFQIDDSLPFNITSSNTILLMNCADNMLHLQVPINCSTNCLCHTYIDHTPEVAACKKVQLCCSFRTGGSQNAYIIRVHANGCMAYQSYVNLDPALPFAKRPAPGLELMWATPMEPVCKTALDCRMLPFSKCWPDAADGGQTRCLCKKGRFWDAATGYCQKCRRGTGCKYRKSQTPVIGSVAGVVVLAALAGFIVYRQRKHTKNAA